MEGTGDTGEGRAEKTEERKKHLDIRNSRKAEGTEGGESAIELRGRGHSLEAGTSVAISGTGEGGTFQHELHGATEVIQSLEWKLLEAEKG